MFQMSPFEKNHIQPYQVNEGSMNITGTNRKRDTNVVIDISEDLKLFLKRKLNLKVTEIGQI